MLHETLYPSARGTGRPGRRPGRRPPRIRRVLSRPSDRPARPRRAGRGHSVRVVHRDWTSRLHPAAIHGAAVRGAARPGPDRVPERPCQAPGRSE